MSESKARELLARLRDAALDDLMHTSDEELRAEAHEDDEDLSRLAADFRCRISKRLGVTRPQRSTVDAKQTEAFRLSLLATAAKHLADAPNDSVTPEEMREIASEALLKLDDSCKSRYCSYVTFDWQSPRSTFGHDARLALAELLLSMYINESEEFDDLFPGSRAERVRALLRDAIHDPQISPFVSISLGTLVSTLCTLALGKASGFEFDPHQNAAQRNQLLRQIRVRKEWRAFRNLIAHQPELVTDSVDPSRAVSGLASMQAALARYRPDTIVAVAGGGEIVANFLCAQIGVDSRNYFVASRKHGEYVLDRELLAGSARKRMVIIDDISRTGSTLGSICNQTLGGIRSVELKTLALVCSGAATSYLRDSFLVLPLVAQSPNVSVPWDNKGSYRATRTNHVFGAERRSPLKVPKAFYERIYEGVST